MSLGLLGGYGSASGSEISDTGEEEEEEEEGGKCRGHPTSSKSHTEPPHNTDGRSHRSESNDSCTGTVSQTPITGVPHSVETSTRTTAHDTTVQEEEKNLRSSSSVTYYGLSGGSDLLDSDSSSSQASDGEQEECEGEVIKERSPLPLPELDGSDAITSSVFSNPYRKAEEAKLAVLKQHVDLSHHVEPSKKQPPKWSKRGKFREHTRFHASSSTNQVWDDRDAPMGLGGGGMQRKHRSGVRECLVPPKKYMKIHQKIQGEERPWTS